MRISVLEMDARTHTHTHTAWESWLTTSCKFVNRYGRFGRDGFLHLQSPRTVWFPAGTGIYSSFCSGRLYCYVCVQPVTETQHLTLTSTQLSEAKVKNAWARPSQFMISWLGRRVQVLAPLEIFSPPPPPPPARADQLKIFTLNRKDRLSVAEWLELGLHNLIWTIDR